MTRQCSSGCFSQSASWSNPANSHFRAICSSAFSFSIAQAFMTAATCFMCSRSRSLGTQSFNSTLASSADMRFPAFFGSPKTERSSLWVNIVKKILKSKLTITASAYGIKSFVRRNHTGPAHFFLKFVRQRNKLCHSGSPANYHQAKTWNR